jgi:hypothetical protein
LTALPFEASVGALPLVESTTAGQYRPASRPLPSLKACNLFQQQAVEDSGASISARKQTKESRWRPRNRF